MHEHILPHLKMFSPFLICPWNITYRVTSEPKFSSTLLHNVYKVMRNYSQYSEQNTFMDLAWGQEILLWFIVTSYRALLDLASTFQRPWRNWKNSPKVFGLPVVTLKLWFVLQMGSLLSANWPVVWFLQSLIYLAKTSRAHKLSIHFT